MFCSDFLAWGVAASQNIVKRMAPATGHAVKKKMLESPCFSCGCISMIWCLCVCACVRSCTEAMCPQWLLKNNHFYLMTLARAVWFGLQKSCNFLEMCGWSSGRTVINRDPTPEQSSQKIHGSITNYPVGQLSNRITHKAHHRQHWTNTEMYHGSDKELIWTHTVAHVLMFLHMFTDVALIGLVSPLGCRFRFRMLGLVAVVWHGMASSGRKSRKYMKDYETIVCIRLLNPFFFFRFISAYISYRQLSAAPFRSQGAFPLVWFDQGPRLHGGQPPGKLWNSLYHSVSVSIRLP